MCPWPQHVVWGHLPWGRGFPFWLASSAFSGCGEGEGKGLPRKRNLAQGAVLPFALGVRLVHSLLPAAALCGHGRPSECPDLPPSGWGRHTQQPGRPYAPQNHSQEARRVLVQDPAYTSPGPRGSP